MKIYLKENYNMILPKLHQFISVTLFYAIYHNTFIHGKASIYDAKSYKFV